MREIRPSGSEGGARFKPCPYPYRPVAVRAQCPGAPVSDPAGIEFCPQTRRIGERRSALAAGSGASPDPPLPQGKFF